MLKFLNVLTAVLLLRLAAAFAPREVLFLISSQDSRYHRQLGIDLRNDIIQQSHSISPDYVINVRMLHEIFNHPGAWSILPILPQLTGDTVRLLHNRTAWIVLCEESTHVALQPLLDRLAQENHTEALYLAHPLHDREATIIHHFAFFENPRWFPYPLLRSGVAFTPVLLKRMAVLIADETSAWPGRRTEFTIDAAHELARFILDNVQAESDVRRVASGVGAGVADGAAAAQGHKVESSDSSELSLVHSQQQQPILPKARKVILKRAGYICPAAVAAPKSEVACVMHAKPMDTATCLPVKRDQVYFAIKTCQRYHKERIPIIEATWAPYAKHKKYFSDVADANMPQLISVGVPNTEVGHCAKTLAILKLALQDIERVQRHLQQHTIRWIFLSDDDTLLSVAGVCEVLGCFDADTEIYLGERYGYRLHAADGFNYITGGGGIAFSLPAARTMLRHCTCPTPSAPDDMILGSCAHSLQLRAIHSPRFHQARPNDYPLELLQLEPPVSFHKFWQLDAAAVHEQWFAAADRQLLHREMLLKQQKLKMQAPNTNESQRSLNLLKKELTKPLNAADSIAAVKKNIAFPVISSLQHAKEKHLDL